MANVSVIEQLKKEFERATKEVKQLGAALVALGSSSSNGRRGTLSAAARKKISLAQKATMGKAERASGTTQTHNVSSGAQKDRRCSASKVGKSERTKESSVTTTKIRLTRLDIFPAGFVFPA